MQRTFSKIRKFNTELRLLSSSSAQLQVDFALLPTISQHRIANALRVSFISVEALQSIHRKTDASAFLSHYDICTSRVYLFLAYGRRVL